MTTQGTLEAAAAPVVAAALEAEVRRKTRRKLHQGLGPDGCRNLAECLLDKFPAETLAALAAQMGRAQK